MTTAELIRLLKKHGCVFVGHNKRHDMYKTHAPAKPSWWGGTPAKKCAPAPCKKS